MRRSPVLFLILCAVARPSHAQQPTVAEIVKRVSQAETVVINNMRTFKPIVEVYIQNIIPDEHLGGVPNQDTYFLGRFDWMNGPRLLTLSGGKASPRVATTAPAGRSVAYLPDGFAAMGAPDWENLDSGRYTFSLVRREFMGEARCFVLDVTPVHDVKDGFSGRIWVEDRGYNIVRFNGINRRIERGFFRKTVSFHVDSWRTNVLAGMWLPAYVYGEEMDPTDTSSNAGKGRIRSQVRMWGYDPRKADAAQQFTEILIEEPEVRDNAAQQGQLSPVLSQRRWEQEAEVNVLGRLEKAGLLATPGDVERVLETVLNNLQVTGNLSLDRPVAARVLLTSPLESFTIGHTIVLSRGLIDVLPDEASLAMMLAHELSHIALGHQLIDSQFAFADKLMVSDDDMLRTLKVLRSPQEEAATDAKVLEMLNTSPYKDKLSDAGLFLRMIAARTKQLPNLIQPHIGDHIADGGQLLRLTGVMQQSPELTPQKLDQIAALPLGARLMLDPWSNRLQLLRSAAELPGTIREKVPLAVTPLMPYLKYAEGPAHQETQR